MNILITGSTGFIGRNLIKRIISDGHTVFTIIRNTTNRDILKSEKIDYIDSERMDQIIDYFSEKKIDGIIHLASCFISEHQSHEIDDLFNTNLLFSTKILEAAVRQKVKWFLNTGTFWQHFNNEKYSPVNLYSATKQAFEVVARYYTELYDINFVTLKLSDTYGPNDNRNKIMNLLIKAMKTGEKLEMSGGGQQLDITYIDDVVNAYSIMTKIVIEDNNRTFLNKSFAVSSMNPIRLKSLVEIFSKVTKKQLNIEWGVKPYRKREVMTPWNTGEILPGWKPLVNLEEGILKMIRENK